MRIRLFAALALLGVAATAAAHEFTLGELVIEHPYSPATPAMARTGAGYLAVRNAGESADALVGVEADFAHAGLHATEVDASGVARMLEVERIEIPPGQTVVLQPQGLHVMFMGLTAPFAEGDSLDATLSFERAGEVAVQFVVEPRADAAHGSTGHEGH